MSDSKGAKSEPQETQQIRALRTAEALAELPQRTDWMANRYDTGDEHVLHLWNPRTGESADIRTRKTTPPPYDEQMCDRSTCLHSRKFHTPACSCGNCPAFIEGRL